MYVFRFNRHRPYALVLCLSTYKLWDTLAHIQSSLNGNMGGFFLCIKKEFCCLISYICIVVLERQIIAYKNYFPSFYEKQPDNVQTKIEWVLNLIRVTKQIPEKYFKHLEGTKSLYEVRVEVVGNIYRIFCFFDKGNLVVLGNGFQKKTQKTPKQEIDRALKIMEEYQNEKK